MLRNLDGLKGSPVYHHRELDVVRLLKSDNEIPCWIYFANADPPKNLQSYNMIANFCSRHHNSNESVYI